jgi:hypothetical protein
MRKWGRAGRSACGEQLERIDVGRAHRREVTVVERRELRFTESLDDGEHSGVDEADPKVGVLGEELCDAPVVLRPQVLDHQRAALEVREQAAERRRGDEVVDFRQDGRRNHPAFVSPAEQLGAGVVVGVVGIERSDEGPGVDYERNGGGS